MRTTRTAALALAAALGLGACGSAGDGAASSSTTSGGASASSKASGSTTSESKASGSTAGATVDGAALGRRMADAMTKAGSGAMSMDLGNQGTASGTFVISAGKLDQKLTMEVQGQTLQVLSVDGLVYLKGLPGATKPWIKVDPKGDDPMSQAFGRMVGEAGSNDPRQIAKALEGSRATLVSRSSTGSVYDVTIDPDTLLGGAQASAPAAQPVTARYTLDAQDRPTEMTVEVEGQRVRIAFTDWGVRTTITAPPAGQVGTFQLPSS